MRRSLSERGLSARPLRHCQAGVSLTPKTFSDSLQTPTGHPTIQFNSEAIYLGPSLHSGVSSETRLSPVLLTNQLEVGGSQDPPLLGFHVICLSSSQNSEKQFTTWVTPPRNSQMGEMRRARCGRGAWSLPTLLVGATLPAHAERPEALRTASFRDFY